MSSASLYADIPGAPAPEPAQADHAPDKQEKAEDTYYDITPKAPVKEESTYDDTVCESLYADAGDSEGLYAVTDDTRIEMTSPSTTPHAPVARGETKQQAPEPSSQTSRVVIAALGILSIVSVVLLSLVIYLFISLQNIHADLEALGKNEPDTDGTMTGSATAADNAAASFNATLFALSDRVDDLDERLSDRMDTMDQRLSTAETTLLDVPRDENTTSTSTLVARVDALENGAMEDLNNRTTTLANDLNAFKTDTSSGFGAVWTRIESTGGLAPAIRALEDYQVSRIEGTLALKIAELEVFEVETGYKFDLYAKKSDHQSLASAFGTHIGEYVGYKFTTEGTIEALNSTINYIEGDYTHQGEFDALEANYVDRMQAAEQTLSDYNQGGADFVQWMEDDIQALDDRLSAAGI